MNENTEVLYNGACPICSREINHYERLSQKQALAIQYDDLADSAKLDKWGLNADEAAERLHVRKDGKIYSGIPAFVILWNDIPQMRWLAKFVSLPGVHKLACLTYDHVLAPLLFRWHLARQKRQSVG